MEQLKILSISRNNALTQQGIITLARAIDARGLPMLNIFFMEELREMTAIGIGAIAHAVIKGCPRLKKIYLMNTGPDNSSHRDVITGMVEAAGRVGKRKVMYDVR